MKTHLLSIIIALISTASLSQGIKIEFSGDEVIKEVYSSENTGSTLHKITLKVIRTGTIIPTFSIPITINASNINTSATDYSILNPNFTITSADFNVSGNFKKYIYIEVKNDNESTDSGDEVFTLSINANLLSVNGAFLVGGTPTVDIGSAINVTIIDAPKDSLKFDPFRITVGANFDFEKTISASFYFDAQAYQPNIVLFKNNGTQTKFGLGFYGSLYNNKYISQDSLQIYDEQFHEIVGTGDSIDLVKYNYQIGISNSIKNIGAEIGLLWGWEHQINPDTYVSTTFLLPEISAIHRRVTSTYSYDRINIDTLYNIPTPDSTRRLVERGFNQSTRDEVLLGFGYIGRFHSKKHGEFMLKFTTGAAFQKSSLIREVKAYYSFRFQLLDPKVGINLGGEVRGYYKHPSPYFGVYLSKSFGLKKLTEY